MLALTQAGLLERVDQRKERNVLYPVCIFNLTLVTMLVYKLHLLFLAEMVVRFSNALCHSNLVCFHGSYHTIVGPRLRLF